jgi:sugar lactone lactonase YvrE
VDTRGNREVVARAPTPIGYSFGWLPDGRLLVSGKDGLLVRNEPRGPLVPYADLRGLSRSGWGDLLVDGRGNVCVNSICFNFLAGEAFGPGIIALVTPDGTVRQVADGIAFPNGMVVTPDNKTLIEAESFAGKLTVFDIAPDGSLSNRHVWADLGGPGNGDGICLDADGAVWTPVRDNACARVREGGQVLQRVEVDRPCYACMLGGEDGKTLFIMAAEWRGTEGIDAVIQDRTGRVLTAPAPAPHAGWP